MPRQGGRQTREAKDAPRRTQRLQASPSGEACRRVSMGPNLPFPLRRDRTRKGTMGSWTLDPGSPGKKVLWVIQVRKTPSSEGSPIGQGTPVMPSPKGPSFGRTSKGRLYDRFRKCPLRGTPPSNAFLWLRPKESTGPSVWESVDTREIGPPITSRNPSGLQVLGPLGRWGKCFGISPIVIYGHFLSRSYGSFALSLPS